MRMAKGLAALCAVFILTSCGGDGGSSGTGSTPAPVTPPMTPPMTPTDPAPIVPATPVGPATIRAFAGTKAAAYYIFWENPDFPGQTAEGFGTRDGLYYPGFSSQIFPFSISLGLNVTSDLSAKYKTVDVIDQSTSRFLTLRGVQAARVVTPITSLLYLTNEQERLKQQLGLHNNGTAGLQASDPDLLAYDAVTGLSDGNSGIRQDAARILAANVRALSMAVAAGVINQGLSPYGQATSFDRVENFLRLAPTRYIFNSIDMTTLATSAAQSAPTGAIRADLLAAAGHLIQTYANTVPTQLSDDDQVAKYTAGIYGWLVPELSELLRENSAAAATAAMAQTPGQVEIAIARFGQRLPFNQDGQIFAATDFYRLTNGSTLRLSQNIAATASPYDQPLFLPSYNDHYIFNAPSGNIRSFPSFLNGGVRSISIPAANQNEISAQISNGDVLISAVGGFRGVSYFDYVTSETGYGQATGRVFVSVR
jgi:hypothetical protein